MKFMREGVDYRIQRDNADPTNRSKWVVIIRGNGFDGVAGRFEGIQIDPSTQKIKYGFQPTFRPSGMSEADMDTPKFREVTNAILFTILQENNSKDAIIYTDVKTGENVNTSLK